MREERKLNKALQRDGIETQSDILDELKQRYPQYAVQANNNDAAKKKRIAVFSSLAAVAACVAIIVPCAVLLPNKDSGEGSNRYSKYYGSDYSIVACEQTLREYSQATGSNILYFDWYDIAEERTTYNYIGNTDGEIIGIEESAFIVEFDEMIHMAVTKTNVHLNALGYDFDNCENEYGVDGHIIKWNVSGKQAHCMFENDGYRYYISIEDGQDENRLFELAGELLGEN